MTYLVCFWDQTWNSGFSTRGLRGTARHVLFCNTTHSSRRPPPILNLPPHFFFGDKHFLSNRLSGMQNFHSNRQDVRASQSPFSHNDVPTLSVDGLGYSNRGRKTKEFMTVHGSAYVRDSGTCTKHIRGLPKKLVYKQKRTIGTSAIP